MLRKQWIYRTLRTNKWPSWLPIPMLLAGVTAASLLLTGTGDDRITKKSIKKGMTRVQVHEILGAEESLWMVPKLHIMSERFLTEDGAEVCVKYLISDDGPRVIAVLDSKETDWEWLERSAQSALNTVWRRRWFA